MLVVSAYLITTFLLLFLVVIGIRKLSSGFNGLWMGSFSVFFLSTLFMIKLRCLPGGNYPCGFMSFFGGFTWHFFAGLVFSVAIWVLSAFFLMKNLGGHLVGRMAEVGYWARPLVGLSLAFVWEILPVSIIHPPAQGGPCPNIPVICHDMPFLGYGGLLYWGLPFVIWATFTLYCGIRTELEQFRPTPLLSKTPRT
jgi:hypothetical protein